MFNEPVNWKMNCYAPFSKEKHYIVVAFYSCNKTSNVCMCKYFYSCHALVEVFCVYLHGLGQARVWHGVFVLWCVLSWGFGVGIGIVA
jgi:hypothetical protein